MSLASLSSDGIHSDQRSTWHWFPPSRTPCRFCFRHNLSWCVSHPLLHSHRDCSPTSGSWSDQLASQCLSSCLNYFYCQVQPLSLLINNLLDGRGQLLPWGGGEEPHCIPRAVPGSPGQEFLLSPSLLVPVSVTVEWSHSSVCPGTLHLVSRYYTGNDFQSKLLWVARPVKWPGELCQYFSLDWPAQLSLGVYQSPYHLLYFYNQGQFLHFSILCKMVQFVQICKEKNFPSNFEFPINKSFIMIIRTYVVL